MKKKKIIVLFILIFISINVQAQSECRMESIEDPCKMMRFSDYNHENNLPDCCMISEPISQNDVDYLEKTFYKTINLTTFNKLLFVDYIRKLKVIRNKMIYAFPLPLKTIKFLC